MTKETLKQYQRLRLERDGILNVIRELEAAMEAPKIQKLTGMPSSGGNGSALETMVQKHIELQRRYLDKLAEMDKLQGEIEDAIESLEGNQRTLMRLRYLQGMRWEDICVSMHYSGKHIHRIHAAALRRIQTED